MEIYISGPMAGFEDMNRKAFEAAEKGLRSIGHQPIVPHNIAAWEHEGDCPPGYTKTKHSSACYLRGDLFWLITRADAVYMLNGWEASIGARLEHEVASRCGLKLFYQPGIRVPVLRSEPGSRSLPYDSGPAVLRDPIGHPPAFQGDASRLFERQYDDE